MTSEDSDQRGAPTSCIECRRLKRKCDRLDPCNVCTKHGKECRYPQRNSSRATRDQVARLERQVEQLQSAIAQHSPPQRKAGRSQSPIRPPPAYPIVYSEPNVVAGSSTGTPRRPSNPNEHHPYAPRRSSVSFVRAPQSPQTSTTEALERQPRSAAGYEWNERYQTFRPANDGTASLSIEPDGEGYLGFASGSTLLRILQICAGGLSLSQIKSQAHAHQTQLPLPQGGYHPTHDEMDQCINAYFEHYHKQYPLVHEATFRAQWNEVIPRPPLNRWELLVNVILGLGAFCAFLPMYVVDYYLEQAISIITVDHLESGSLVLVQAFCLLSNLTQKRNKPNSGSVYLGIALRLAIGLGLHRELPMWNITPFEREVRRRVWWTVFMFDAGASITFGRPILLPTEEADTILPHNVVDRLFSPSSTSIPPATSEPTIYTSLIYQASFHVVSNQIYNRVISTPPPTTSEILSMDSDLEGWYTTLPEYMRTTSSITVDRALDFSRHKLFWRYSNLRIINFRRAFLERAVKGLSLAQDSSSLNDADPDAQFAQMCLANAIITIDDIYVFSQIPPSSRLESWYALHFLFQASFVPLIALQTDLTSPSRATWTAATNHARQVLESLAPTEPLAERCLQIVNLLAPPASPSAGLVDNGRIEMGSRGLDELLFSNSTAWGGEFGGIDMAQTLLPFADLATLSSFWPGGSS